MGGLRTFLAISKKKAKMIKLQGDFQGKKKKKQTEYFSGRRVGGMETAAVPAMSKMFPSLLLFFRQLGERLPRAEA